jgi:Fe2+ transport system protein B
MNFPHRQVAVPLRTPLFRGERRLRLALVGLAGAGKRTLFDDVSSANPVTHAIAGNHGAYRECVVQVGLDEAIVMDLPSGAAPPPALLERADALIQVVDASDAQGHGAMTRRLCRLGKPVVVALNHADEASAQGVPLHADAWRRAFGVPVVATVAHMGFGVRELFQAAVSAVRDETVPARRDDAWPTRGWRHWIDELFLHPRWGFVGSGAVLALVLFMVFQVSAFLDAMTTVRLAEALAAWRPDDTPGVVLRAVADGLVGLVGILVPYMIPIVMLLVALEQAGIMQRVAFVLDRAFHRVGLHGDVAAPFLTGLGCNVPAIVSAAQVTRGRERFIAAVLVTFVPCSARSAIILAVAGKYFGVPGVFAIFALSFLLIALLGAGFARTAGALAPGRIQEIPALALPRWRPLLATTWERSRDVLTIVLPLLVAGSVALALLHQAGADAAIDGLLSPVTSLWLGLPIALGVPLLFGVLRKELSLLMIFQALGTLEIGAVLDATQMMTLLAFLTLYVPCLSTFAVMVRTIGRRDALASVAISIGVALAAGAGVRWAMAGAAQLAHFAGWLA